MNSPMIAVSFLVILAFGRTGLATIVDTTSPSISGATEPSPSFSWPVSVTTRYATSITPKPIIQYAVPYSAVSSRFQNLSSSTWPNWTPSSLPTTLTASEKYGDTAYSQLWYAAGPLNFTRGIYSTTVSPTPVPSSELIYPPPLVFNPNNGRQRFPEDFIIGAAGSSAQCEGAVADEGKSPSLLDMLYTLFSRVPSLASSAMSLIHSGGALAPDYTTNEHYYLYQQDIERFAAIGLKQYSFSIPMGRILPFAVPGSPVNSQALQHYSDVVDFVLAKGMEPIISLYHWETPLQFYGGGGLDPLVASVLDALSNSTYGLIPGFSFGFQNATFEDAYVNYAEIVMSHLGDRVPKWVTFNEPQIGANNGAAVNTVLKAHARAVHYYRDVLNGTGKVSMKMVVGPGLPQDPTNPDDIEAASIYNDVYIGAFLKPLVYGQDYPESFKMAVPDYVPLTETDLSLLNDTLDYVSVDIYSVSFLTKLVDDYAACAKNTTSNPDRRYPICLNTTTMTTTGWSQGWTDDESGSLLETSTLRTQLRFMYETYNKPIMVSETGFNTPRPDTLEQNLDNYPQSVFLLNELDQILASIYEDGVDVIGLLVWTWGDDLQFTTYEFGDGLQYINHTTQERKYRRSFFDVLDFVESRRA